MISFYVHNAHGVSKAGALLPAGDDHQGVALLDEATLLAKLDAELHTGINVLNPVRKRFSWNTIIQFSHIKNYYTKNIKIVPKTVKPKFKINS